MDAKQDLVKDPVCGMMIDLAIAAARSGYNGQTFYFCAMGCKRAFDRDPGKYLAKESMAL
ncbi:MAG TPA: YHS domain-containing protein [Candidatus Edwardsbacteria bacterium]|nr:YHS domain-containing protein [Candidatus Edwardsbacteria bacterium]